jgi:hypothetical protein
MMIKREIEEYRRAHSGDQATFDRWLTANAVIGGAFFVLIALGSFFSGEASKSIAQKNGLILHADAK